MCEMIWRSQEAIFSRPSMSAIVLASFNILWYERAYKHDLPRGLGIRPPPTNPACNSVLCGARNGLCLTSGLLDGSIPATE